MVGFKTSKQTYESLQLLAKEKCMTLSSYVHEIVRQTINAK